MNQDIETLKRIYARFDARDIDGVLGALADDVAWANGMEGGHVFRFRDGTVARFDIQDAG